MISKEVLAEEHGPWKTDTPPLPSFLLHGCVWMSPARG